MSISGMLVGGSIPEQKSNRIIGAIFGFPLGGAMTFFIGEVFGIDIAMSLGLT